MKIDIIGAGICGLTTALALEQKGFKPTIYEQTEELKEVGAGIILATNAMRVFKELNIANKIISAGSKIEVLNITDKSLKALSKIDLTYFKEKYNIESIAIHRSKLQEILVSNLKHTKINLGYKLNTTSKNEKGYTLYFENGSIIKSQFLLATDGINSILRKEITSKSIIRKPNQICWRGITNFSLPDQYKNEVNESWGKNGTRFGFNEYDKNKVYWYALKSFENSKDEFSINQLNTLFKEYPKLIHKIINSTSLEKIHTSEITDLKPIYNWYDDFCCLLGDAAHATTPNMGQGACQAIEDAFIISNCIVKHKNNNAFEEFKNLRIKQAHKVVNQSWVIGKISHWQNPLAIFLRNTMLKTIPASLNIKQQEKLFQLNR